MSTLPEPRFGALGDPWARAIAKVLLATERAAANADARAGNVQSAISGLSARVANLAATILEAATGLVNSAISALTLSSISGNLDQSRVVNTWTKDVSATNVAAATVSASQVNVSTGITSTAIYSTLLTGTFRDLQVKDNGVVGYVPSSARFKEDITALEPADPRLILALTLVSYWYTADPEQRVDVGVIAEQVHNLGYWWLVDYDEEGKPFGFKYAKGWLAILPYLANVEERLLKLEAA